MCKIYIKYWSRNISLWMNRLYYLNQDCVQISNYLNHTVYTPLKKQYGTSKGLGFFFDYMEMLIAVCSVMFNIWSCIFQNICSKDWTDIFILLSIEKYFIISLCFVWSLLQNHLFAIYWQNFTQYLMLALYCLLLEPVYLRY
jgi:hypothetical protein